jgi:hypothetical protein
MPNAMPSEVRRSVSVAAIFLLMTAALQLLAAAVVTWGQTGDLTGSLLGIALISGAPAGAAAWGLRLYRPWGRTLALVLTMLWLGGGVLLSLFQLVLRQPHVQHLGYPAPDPWTFRLGLGMITSAGVILWALTRRSVRAVFTSVAA